MLYLFLMAKSKILPKKQPTTNESLAKQSLEKHHMDDIDEGGGQFQFEEGSKKLEFGDLTNENPGAQDKKYKLILNRERSESMKYEPSNMIDIVGSNAKRRSGKLAFE